MEILESFFAQPPGNDLFYPRKLSLPDEGSFHLYGARATGKTALILEWIRSLPAESYLYLDCQDPIFALEDIGVEEVEEFLNEESVQTLVLDHYYDDFFSRLPEVERLVTVGRLPVAGSDRPSFELFPLDYEEFLGFDRGSSPSASFTRFLRTGSLPAAGRVPLPAVAPALRHLFFEEFDEQEGRLLLILARFHGRKSTVHQIYATAKESFRISKDWTYQAVRRFTREGVLLEAPFVDGVPGRKLYLYDFMLSRYLNKRQPFAVTFDSMIVLALFKHGIPFGAVSQGYLLEGRRELVLPAAFEEETRLWTRVQKRFGTFSALGVDRVSVVTVSSRYEFEINGIRFEALPFYEWSVLNE